jgi:acyl-CoA thioesterase-1
MVMRLLLSLLVVVGVSGWANASATAGKTVLVLGDSISAALGIQRRQGWVALMETRLQALNPEHRVINASISGDTTGGGLARLPRALAEYTPDIVVIELGGNDGLRGYPIERIRSNLDKLVDMAQINGAAVVVAGMHIPPNYGPRYTQAFHAAFGQAASSADAALVPFLLDGVATDVALMQDDGIHPTAVAQGQILDNIWPAIEALL